MRPLRYHVRQESTGFAWELLTEDLTIVAKGHEIDAVKARAAAMLAVLLKPVSPPLSPGRPRRSRMS
jgi:hypothetical protein